MDNIFEKTLLYDFYGELLTKRQKEIYELYYLNDYSLGEISENQEISRQGVYDTIKRCDKQLVNYEEKLQLVKKFVENKEIINQIYEYTQEIEENNLDTITMMNRIKSIQMICREILKTL